jgi:hypothetical protein
MYSENVRYVYESLRIPKSPLRLCRACVAEDLDFHGVSYWRRTHQLVGVSWCLKHGTPLSVAKEGRAFLGSPRAAAKSATEIPMPPVSCLQKDTLIQKYVCVALNLLDVLQRPLIRDAVSWAVVDQAKCPRSPKSVAPDIGLHVADPNSRGWLSEHFPQAAEDCFGSWDIFANKFVPLLPLGMLRPSGYLVSLALAQDADQAVAEIIKAEETHWDYAWAVHRGLAMSPANVVRSTRSELSRVSEYDFNIWPRDQDTPSAPSNYDFTWVVPN